MTQPVIGITMGDPLGIGPEVIVKALDDAALRRSARFVIYGMNEQLTLAAEQADIRPFWFRVQHDSPRTLRDIRDQVVVFDFPDVELNAHATGGPTRAGGYASRLFIETAITDAMRKPANARSIHGIVTAPISKKAWDLADFHWPGHTELLASRSKAKRAGMAFVSPRLRVTLATVHIALMDIRNVLTIGAVSNAIDRASDLCHDLGIKQPRIAVCGLNPHAGEDGLFGDEESRLIVPAIELARQRGLHVHGPFPGDTVFNATISGAFDVVVAMYHDQGLIPIKLLDRDRAVNVTVGLPFVRTSPDHGTAFDIAGQNQAEPGSMHEAIRLAVTLTTARLATAQPDDDVSHRPAPSS
ncbi:MAG: 4-hydroxythreonine-4-phosphate dehydrogenase PdxA [Phycisphaerales bacterium]